MRLELLYNPRLLCAGERLAIESVRRRRLAALKGTQAAGLALGHIDTLELVQLASPAGISVMYDIGANVGTWSLLAKALVPDARIEAFEPLPKHQTEFLRNFTGSAELCTLLQSDLTMPPERFTSQIFRMPPASCSRMRRTRMHVADVGTDPPRRNAMRERAQRRDRSDLTVARRIEQIKAHSCS